MILLDTDHVTHLQYPESEPGRRLLARLRGQPDRQIATTIISLEEQFRGWMARLAAEHDVAQQVPLYRRLSDVFKVFDNLTLVPFDQPAADRFATLARVRIGTMDRKIAAIALATDSLLLTANARDFEQVPGLNFADWSA